jgi:hypothetical protein
MTNIGKYTEAQEIVMASTRFVSAPSVKGTPFLHCIKGSSTRIQCLDIPFYPQVVGCSVIHEGRLAQLSQHRSKTRVSLLTEDEFQHA